MDALLQENRSSENGVVAPRLELRKRARSTENTAVHSRRRFLIRLAGFLAIPESSLLLESKDVHRDSPSAAPVDINHATAMELMRVPGMTRTWAARIVRFRPYRMKTDLLDRGVVTGEVYARIKDYVIAHRVAQ